MNLKMVLGSIIVAILLLLGIIFALASAYETSRLVVAAFFFLISLGIIYFTTQKPKVNIQKVEFSGQMKAVALNCPNCSASITSKNIKLVSGVPYATCSYCGKTVEVTEEPKW